MYIYRFSRRHRCPHKPNNDPLGSSKNSVPCKVTEYSLKYKWTDGRPRESLRPPQRALTQDAPMECHTIQKVDFVPHSVRPISPKAKPTYVRPEGRVEKDSEYKLKYTGEQVPPPQPIKPTHNKLMTDTQFQGNTTQKTDFVDWGTPQLERHGEQKVYEPPVEKFKAISTVQADYVNKGHFSPTQSMKPPQIPKTSSEPFDSSTNYKHDFKAHEILPRVVQEKEVYQPRKEVFGGTSTFKSDYRQHSQYKPSPSMKPTQVAMKTDKTFDSKSIQNTDFRAWELPSKQKRTPPVYVPPTEKFPSRSTFRDDYKDYGPVTPSRSLKPPQNPVNSGEPFQGSTVQKLDYQMWTLDSPTKPIIHGKDYQPPVQKFSGQSTFQTSYKGKYGPPADSAKPPPIAAQGSGKIDCETIYRNMFSPKSFTTCPTTFFKGDLDTTSRFLYSHQDKTGHKFFAPMEVITKDAAKYAMNTGQA